MENRRHTKKCLPQIQTAGPSQFTPHQRSASNTISDLDSTLHTTMKLIFALLTAGLLAAQKTSRGRPFDLDFFLTEYVHVQGLHNVHVLQDYRGMPGLSFRLFSSVWI